MNTNKIGEIIRDARKAKKLTQKQLAQKLGKVESTVRMWELGKNKPPAEILGILGNELDIPLGELLISAGYFQEFGAMIEDNFKKPPTIPTLGEAIREAREDFYDVNGNQLNITLSDISKETNIPQSILEQIENDEHIQLSDVQLMALAKALDVTFAYLYLLSGKGDTLFEDNHKNNALIQLRPLRASDVKCVNLMTFEDFYESKMRLTNGSMIGIDSAKEIYNSFIFANKIDLLLQLKALPNLWEDSPDIEYLLNFSEIQLNYRGRILSPTDKQKILAKINEIADEFEYQD
ncbi:helix-turn-helix domain-containing protein [Lysinibacillus sp. NPDC096418]|uniref:helix-turn-helix domain-containing protein n=1 Tax=Lysinibacillus sp. NPDC096418 TaxID=3364138 RepID=UPI003807C7D3